MEDNLFLENLQELRLLLDIDKEVQAKMKIFESYAGLGQNDNERAILANWDNWITNEIFLLMKRNYDIE